MSDTIKCPNCKKSNTRKIQNGLALIENPAFSQGEEWLGYCYDCGTLYDYYGDSHIVNMPYGSNFDEINSEVILQEEIEKNRTLCCCLIKILVKCGDLYL